MQTHSVMFDDRILRVNRALQGGEQPSADITVINAGRGGEDAPEMMKRLQSSVIDLHPEDCKDALLGWLDVGGGSEQHREISGHSSRP